MAHFKRTKQEELQDISAVEDRISSLPDEILLHILSFLPTRDAFATSVLSRRWEYLWVFVPNIDLDDFLVYPTEDSPYTIPYQFRNFVDGVLGIHACSELKKFRLSCQASYYPDHIGSWISAAIKRKVQELDLCFKEAIPSALPSSTFFSKTLTILTVELDCALQIPSCIFLPALKALQLIFVTFVDDDSTGRLLSGCPSLEKLVFVECDWSNSKLVRISIPTLKIFVLDDMPTYGSPASAYALNGCQVVIDAENLCCFMYRGYLLNDICLCNLSRLAGACIDLPASCKATKETVRGGFKLLTGLKNVRSLSISDGVIQVAFEALTTTKPSRVASPPQTSRKCLLLAHMVAGNLPIFANLTRLEFNDVVGDMAIQMLVGMLRHTPNLESLVFAEGLNENLCLGEGDSLLTTVPKCFSACLKSFSLHKFSASPTDVYMMKYLLETAPLLERLNVKCRKYILGDPKKVDEVCAQVMMLPRSSSSCVISIMRNLFG